MLKPKNREWILLADRAKAKIFTRHYVDGVMQEYLVLEHPAARARQHDMGTDAPGHSHGSASHHRYAYEDHADFPEQESRNFLEQVAIAINDAVAQDEMDKLILVALPKTMAVLKAGFSKATMSRVSAEYAKDLVGMPEHVLKDRFNQMEKGH